jgi:serine/threonine-protein kinase
MIEKEVGNYRILEKIGEGGMGIVYKAIDQSLDRLVAVKALNSEYCGYPDAFKRFKREARMQANLNHTNIAKIYEFLTDRGQGWLVMEYVEGETISAMLQRRGPFTHGDAVPLFKQVLLGVGKAHQAKIVHRDIKPANLMVNRQGIVKIMDFGIAKDVTGGAGGLTSTGTRMGTASYMAPEQIRRQPVDTRTDIYSLGVTLYQMLTAKLPFLRGTDVEIQYDHLNTPPPPPSRYSPLIPRGIENAVLKALQKDPDKRFQTTEEFGAALEHSDDFGSEVLSLKGQSLRLENEAVKSGSAPVSAKEVVNHSRYAWIQDKEESKYHLTLPRGETLRVILKASGYWEVYIYTASGHRSLQGAATNLADAIASADAMVQPGEGLPIMRRS